MNSEQLQSLAVLALAMAAPWMKLRQNWWVPAGAWAIHLAASVGSHSKAVCRSLANPGW